MHLHLFSIYKVANRHWRCCRNATSAAAAAASVVVAVAVALAVAASSFQFIFIIAANVNCNIFSHFSLLLSVFLWAFSLAQTLQLHMRAALEFVGLSHLNTRTVVRTCSTRKRWIAVFFWYFFSVFPPFCWGAETEPQIILICVK